MKTTTLLIAIAFLSIITSCTQTTQTEKDIKMYTEVWYQVINEGKTDLINGTNFDETFTLITEPENLVGIDALKTYWDAFLKGFSDVTFTTKEVFGQDGNLVKHWQFTGKHSGDFFGIPASGNTVDVEGTALVKMKNGKIVQEQYFFDVSNMMTQLGFDPNHANTAIIEKAYNHFSKGEVPEVLSMMSPDILWNEATSSSYSDRNPYKGPDAVLNGVFKRLGEDNEYFKLENIKLTGLDDNKVLATMNYDFKSKKTGETSTTTVVHEWTLENGKIIGFQQYIGLGKQ